MDAWGAVVIEPN